MPRTKTQPPGFVFALVWPLLYLSIGWSWMITRNNPTLYWLHMLLIASLNLWVYVTGCRNRYRQGALVFLAIIASALGIWIMSSLQSIGEARQWYVPLLMVPLITWLLFAHQLNIHIVERSTV